MIMSSVRMLVMWSIIWLCLCEFVSVKETKTVVYCRFHGTCCFISCEVEKSAIQIILN